MTSDILLDPVICNRVFYPQYDRLNSIYEVECGDSILCCYYRRLTYQSKTLVIFHGNGEVANDYVTLFDYLAELIGFNVFISEYRGYGGSTGKPNLYNLVNDVNFVIEAIGRPPEDLVVFGRSLGIFPALGAISNFPDISGLIIESGICDLGSYLNALVTGTKLEEKSNEIQKTANHFMNISNVLAKFTGASLFLHAKNDRFILVNNAYQLYEWASAPKRIKVFNNGDHSTIMFANLVEYAETIRDFMKSI